MTYLLREFVNVDRLNVLMEHASLNDKERKQLKAYRKKVTAGCVTVAYEKKNIGKGRRYAEGSLSFQNFRRAIRHTLCYDTKLDIDMKNAHPTFLSQYCLKQKINCEELDDYVQYRDIRLKDLMDTCKIDRSMAKDFVLVVMYLGCMSDYMVTYGITTLPPKWLDLLETGMKRVATTIDAMNPELSKQVASLEKKNNKLSSTMSYVAQIIEDDLLMNAITKLTDLGFVIETLCFDGVLIKKQEVPEGTLEDVSVFCFDKTGYKIEFEIKAMSNMLDLEDIISYDFSTYDFEHTQFYNQEYCASLTHSSAKGTYLLRKTYLEKFICKIMSPDSCFMFENGNDKDGITIIEPHIFPAQSLSCLLKPIFSGLYTSTGLPISFYDKWTTDHTQRVYRKYDFIPYVYTPPALDVFNMFQGFHPNVFGKAKANLTVWFDLCEALCGDNHESDYFHKFIANIFQTPTKRPPVSIIIKGKQGIGKNLVLDSIGHMLGDDHYITSSKPSDFFGEHAEGFCRKLLVNINESEGKDTFDYEGRIKSFITEPTITINPKFVRPTTVNNYARAIFTTNKPTPIPIDVRSQDRRMVVYEGTERFKKYDASTWAAMYKYFRTSDFMATLFHHYMNMDLSQVDWINDRPITKAYREMCNMFSPTEALFLESYIDTLTERDKVKDIPSIDLFTEYETYCKSNRFMKENNSPNSRAFIGRLNSLGLPMCQHKGHGNIIYWKFVPDEVYAFMTERRWIGDYGRDTIVKEQKETMDMSLFR